MADSASQPLGTDSGEVTVLLPDDIVNKRNASHVPTLLILLAIAVMVVVLAATQNAVPLLILLVGSMALLAVFGKRMTKRFMADANRRMARFITDSLAQSDAFDRAVYETLSNGVFTRVFRRTLMANYEMEYLVLLVEPAGEPAWTIQMLQGAKGYRLRRKT